MNWQYNSFMQTLKARGGRRKNAGRKTEGATGPTKKYVVSLDDDTVTKLDALGAGNRSKGVREAVRRAWAK